MYGYVERGGSFQQIMSSKVCRDVAKIPMQGQHYTRLEYSRAEQREMDRRRPRRPAQTRPERLLGNARRNLTSADGVEEGGSSLVAILMITSSFVERFGWLCFARGSRVGTLRLVSYVHQNVHQYIEIIENNDERQEELDGGCTLLLHVSFHIHTQQPPTVNRSSSHRLI